MQATDLAALLRADGLGHTAALETTLRSTNVGRESTRRPKGPSHLLIFDLGLIRSNALAGRVWGARRGTDGAYV
jgi:hypothetical protein